MATEYLFSNNATTTLAQSVSATATVLNVASGDGSLFPSPTSGQAFAVTLVDAATGLTNEICYCTSRSGDQLTVVRGREGTNAIAWAAGDTCANYITADVMESWLQESDLNGYATQSWADGRYIRSPANPNTDARILTISRNKTSGGIFAAADDGSNTQLQPSGDYATNTALNSVNTNLQNQINNRVLKSGDTMTGTLFQNVGSNAAVVATGMSGPATAGQNPWTPQFVSKSSNDGSLSALFCARDRVGYYPYLSLQFTEQNGTWHELQFRSDDRLYTDSGNVFALESDISNLQTQINGKENAGVCVPVTTYINDFSTSDSRVINLPYGHRIQFFTIYVGGNGTNSHRITYPQAFSGNSTPVFNLNDTGNSRSVSLANNTTPDSTGFNISVSGHGNSTYGDTDGLTLTVIAIGPR